MPSLLGSWLGRRSGRSAKPGHRVRFVSATRFDEAGFWSDSALGQSLAELDNPHVVADVAYANKAGLALVYNAGLQRAAPGETLVFLHDDVWLDQPDLLAQIALGLERFDVIGVAGNRRRAPGQPTWMHRPDGEVDTEGQSGAIRLGSSRGGRRMAFGPCPAPCELLDGVFLAARRDTLVGAGVRFDERFAFHFYDLDFCRAARAASLAVGTWPVELTHQSETGAFLSPDWQAGYEAYQAKWGN